MPAIPSSITPAASPPPERSRSALPALATQALRLQLCTPRVHPTHLYPTGDVLDVVRTEILDGEAQLVEHLIACHAAYADSSRLGQRLQPRGDIDAVAKDVALIDDDVADVDADT